jgi:large subunit ribosomal protein L27
MSKTKSAGSTSLGRDSKPKYLGVKKYEGEAVKTGMIIVRQKGLKFIPGKNVKKGRDDTLYSLKEGKVAFGIKRKKKFSGAQRTVKIVNVE